MFKRMGYSESRQLRKGTENVKIQFGIRKYDHCEYTHNFTVVNTVLKK